MQFSIHIQPKLIFDYSFFNLIVPTPRPELQKMINSNILKYRKNNPDFSCPLFPEGLILILISISNLENFESWDRTLKLPNQ